MSIQRIIKHLLFMDWQTRRAFPRPILKRIENAITESEPNHTGEILFVVEGGLECAALLRGTSARERAIEIFSELRVWDTEQNNGVLIYVLLADHAVEIVADRGIHARVSGETWDLICRHMEASFARSAFQEGVMQGISSVSAHMVRNFASQKKGINELPDEPVLLT